MRRSFFNNYRNIITTSTENDSCHSSDLDPVNPSGCHTQWSECRPTCYKLPEFKLHNSRDKRFHRSSSFPNIPDKFSVNNNQHQRISYLEGTSRGKLGKEGTPRILRALRRHSGKASREDKSLSLKGDNSKSEVVILYQGEPTVNQDPSSSTTSKTLVRTSKSDHTIVTQSHPPNQHSRESPRIPPKLQPRRRRPPHRRPLRRQSLNVNIIQESRVVDSGRRTPSPCLRQPTNDVIRHMAYSVNERGTENRRVFPFQSTPSGNLKVIPNQVIFESKKVSVLVADPRHAKVNVKAELNKPEVEIGDSGQAKDLPPGVTPSAIDHLQAQRKLPRIPTQYVPRTQPHRGKLRHDQMEMKQNNQGNHHRHQPGNEVPLASLGFTVEQPIDWENINLPEKTDLYDELERRITNYKNADCIVHLGHDEFHCHLLVLQSYSTFFDDKNCKEIDLTGSGVTSRAFSIIYDWMISCSAESCHLLRRDNILEIFTGAQVLGIKELEEQCWSFIDNEELFSEDTAFLLYLDAKKIRNSAVMELMIPRIMKFFLMLVSTKDFLELSVDELCLLLRSDYICVNSEMEVLMSAVRWLMYDWETRKEYLLDILKCVRFGLIAPWQLVDVKRNPENPEFMELMSYPEIQKMVDDGLAFVIIKYWYSNQTQDYYHWIELLGLTEPANRNWTGEEKNYVTYREFLLYLEEYQRTKISELKTKNIEKSQTMSNDCAESPVRQPNNYQSLHNPRASSSGQVNLPPNIGGRPSRCPRMPVGGQGAQGAPPTLGMPPEILSKYLSSLGSHSKVIIPGHTDVHQTRNHVDDARCDQWKSNSGLNWKKLRQRKREFYRRNGKNSDSSKSEEEAATTIQAVYRGYKTRQTFQEIKKLSSDENQNARRVAQLLSIPSINKNNQPLEPLRQAGGGGVSGDPRQVNTEIPQPTPRSRKALEAVETLHPPNPLDFDAGTSSSQFFETDTEDPFTPRLQKSTDTNGENTVLVFGGIDPHVEYGVRGNTGRDIYRYKSVENVWEFVGELPEPRHHHSVALMWGKIYLIGGADPREDFLKRKCVALGTVWSYDIATRSWYNEPELLTPRKNFALVNSHGRMYAIGGQDKNGVALRSVEVFDPTEGTWRIAPPMHTARIGPASTKYGNYIWVGGGMTISKREPISKDVECFDPSKNTWINIEPLRVPRCFASFHVMFDTLYIIGGAGRSLKNVTMTESIDTIDVWDPELRTWREFSKITIGRHSHSTGSIGNQLLVIGGLTTIFMKTLRTVECFCFERSRWIRGVATLPYALSGHASVSLNSQNSLRNY
ncbi:uncharacterized protein [Fopius arisanus]|uniref:Uncharacterized protein isoform X3 n=1 Tax=Fopius arisanus TaxID=64838 RepID=A0A9R1TFG8_9HYME|nr:PREDICTED: uncharacterized protein LOC105269825 isoform X3 [Fopius arisanus]